MMCLKNKSDPGVAETGQFFVRKSKNISPINGNPSAVGFGKCSENVQKSRFTGAAGSDNADNFSSIRLKTNILQDDERPEGFLICSATIT